MGSMDLFDRVAIGLSLVNFWWTSQKSRRDGMCVRDVVSFACTRHSFFHGLSRCVRSGSFSGVCGTFVLTKCSFGGLVKSNGLGFRMRPKPKTQAAT